MVTSRQWRGTLAGSSNGRTAAFEAVYLGSNPSPATQKTVFLTTAIIYLYARKSVV
jgi:hypothetical protein